MGSCSHLNTASYEMFLLIFGLSNGEVMMTTAIAAITNHCSRSSELIIVRRYIKISHTCIHFIKEKCLFDGLLLLHVNETLRSPVE